MGGRSDVSAYQQAQNSRYVYGPKESKGRERGGVIRVAELHSGKPREALSPSSHASPPVKAQP